MDYSDLLLNPLWIAKAKRIRKRDGYKCTVCNSKKSLEVHHTYYYTKKTEPWRYPDESLLTVCHKCHNDWHIHNENTYIKKPKPVKKNKRYKKIKQFRKSKVKVYRHNRRLGIQERIEIEMEKIRDKTRVH